MWFKDVDYVMMASPYNKGTIVSISFTYFFLLPDITDLRGKARRWTMSTVITEKTARQSSSKEIMMKRKVKCKARTALFRALAISPI